LARKNVNIFYYIYETWYLSKCDWKEKISRGRWYPSRYSIQFTARKKEL